MSNKYKQTGEFIDYTNSTGSQINVDSVVVIGSNGDALLGVAMVDIPNGETGAVAIHGVFKKMPKVSAAVIAMGETLTWDVSASAFDDNAATAAAGDVTGPCAVAMESAGNGATEIEVLFTGVPGTLN